MYTIVIEKRTYCILNTLLQYGQRHGELDFIREKQYIEYFIIVQKRTGAWRVVKNKTELGYRVLNNIYKKKGHGGAIEKDWRRQYIEYFIIVQNRT